MCFLIWYLIKIECYIKVSNYLNMKKQFTQLMLRECREER